MRSSATPESYFDNIDTASGLRQGLARAVPASIGYREQDSYRAVNRAACRGDDDVGANWCSRRRSRCATATTTATDVGEHEREPHQSQGHAEPALAR
jgi:hypothetical protein